MLGKLVMTEEHIAKKTSSLRLFVRLDCSVFFEPRIQAHQLFVNEITRSQDTALWLDKALRWEKVSFLAAFTRSLYHAAVTGALCKLAPPHPRQRSPDDPFPHS